MVKSLIYFRIMDSMWIARKYNAAHYENGASRLGHLMDVYLGEGAGKEQTHEALNDVQDLLRVMRAMADKKKIGFSILLDLGKRKTLCGFKTSASRW